MKVRHLINLLITSLWLLATSGLVIAMIWITQPSLVNRLDSHFRSVYLYGPKDWFDDIVEQLDQGQDWTSARRSLEQLLGELEDVQQGDHNSYVKRTTYHLLVANSIRTGNLKEALSFSTAWLSFSPNDVMAQALRNRALYLSPEFRDEGLLQMMILKEKFPHSLTVADSIATTFASNGELGRAFQEYEPFLPFNPDTRKRNIDDVIMSTVVQFQPGDTTPELSLSFLDGEIVEVALSTSPASTNLVFSNVGMQQTNTGFKKYATPATATLELQAVETPSPAEITATVRVPVPETLSLIADPRFRDLVLTQLEEKVTTRHAYERFTRS